MVKAPELGNPSLYYFPSHLHNYSHQRKSRTNPFHPYSKRYLKKKVAILIDVFLTLKILEFSENRNNKLESKRGYNFTLMQYIC